MPSFVVITGAKGDIYLDTALTEYYDYARMGAVFPIYRRTESGPVEIILTTRDDEGGLVHTLAYVRREDTHEGYLPYTPRTVIQQAFALLNTPYGWGGMYGEQDCSRFIQEIFATVGIHLPRNSSAQARVGTPIGEFGDSTSPLQKWEVLLHQGIGGLTLVGMPGHIMLYLGMVDGRPYAIHAFWAYREKGEGEDIVRVVNRVAVTDLSLGKDSQRGSLLERTKTIRILQ